MAPQTETRLNEPIHLLLLRSVVYSAALGAAAWPVASAAVSISVALAGLFGVIAGRKIAASQIRTWVAIAGGLGLVGVAWMISSLLGSSTGFAETVGLSSALSWTQGTALTLGALGLIVPLRVASLRRRSFALLEAAAAAAVVVLLFAGHRDYQLGNPRFLSDWAFSTGRDPWEIMLIAGIASAGGVVFFLLPRQKASRNAAAVVVLSGLIFAFFFLFVGGSANLPGQDSSGGSYASKDKKLNYKDRDRSNRDMKPTIFVVFHDSFTPISGSYHVRTEVFSQLDGGSLGVSNLTGLNADVPKDFPAASIDVPAAGTPAEFSQEIRTSVGVIAPYIDSPSALINPIALAPETNPNPSYFKHAYAARSRVLATKNKEKLDVTLKQSKAGNPTWSSEVRNHYLEAPSDPRYKELADRLLADAKGELGTQWANSPYAQQQVIAQWVHKNTTYNLAPGNGDLPDPTADFLFGKRKGCCVHYATAMAFLLRTQGIPTRVAGGFMAPLERRGHSASMLFQESDGHAWCEMYLDGFGWVELDGGPEKSDEPMPQPPSKETKSAIEKKYTETTDTNRVADVGQPQENKPRELGWGIGSKIGIVILAVLGSLYLIKGWRRLAPRYASQRDAYRIAYRATLDRLAELGVFRQFGETREQFAQRVSSMVPEFVEFTRLHLRVAMGAAETLERPAWLEMQNQVERRLPESFSRTRRIVGLLNPVSWLMAQ